MSNRNFDLNNMRQSLGRVVEDALNFASGAALTVPVDIVEVEDKLVVLTVPLLGIVPESLDISVSGDHLLIQGETAPDDTYPEQAYLRRERRYGAFQRKVQIPMSVQADAARAELKNGVLKISLPKQPEANPTIINVVSQDDDQPAANRAPAWDGSTSADSNQTPATDNNGTAGEPGPQADEAQ